MSSIHMSPKLKAERMNWGAPAPDWLRYAETYVCGLNWSLLTAGAGKITFATHVPVNQALFKRLNEMGIKPIPYIQYLHLPMYSVLFGVELRRHPEWIAVDENGNKKRTHFWESSDMKNWYVICPQVAGYMEAMEKWVKHLMEMGAGGVFVDCVESSAYQCQRCYGPAFGLHQHTSDGTLEAYAEICRRIRKVIKDHNPEGALLGNGNPLGASFPQECRQYFDAYMIESYICTTVSKERWFDWHKQWDAFGKRLAPAIKAGKQMQMLSYPGNTKYGIKEDSYFCYCTARLGGFVWCGQNIVKHSDSPAAVLYATRLGKPLAGEREYNQVHYRLFEGGLVAVNPTGKKRFLTINSKLPGKELYDLFNEKKLSVSGKKGAALMIPANSGRVYLCVPEALEKNRMSLDDMNPEMQATIGPGHMLRIETDPPMGEVCFRVDGTEYFTRGGQLRISFFKGALFGKAEIFFDKPGRHTVEFVGENSKKMKKCRFSGWKGILGASHGKTEIRVKGATTLVAKFTVPPRIRK